MPLVYEEETYRIRGILFEVYNNLGSGFSEVVYKDAIEHELTLQQIDFEREREYVVDYKGQVLKHKFYADFVLFGKIVLEIKSCDKISAAHKAQCINYLKVSKNKLALLANFSRENLELERIIY
ncbi:MAG: GxxExxY protein [Flavobacterium sp.]|uniref:GxxExxY protein n=1 Tax=Flavobacterium sp. TaxID=239 RepID=UPI0012059B00|nr:GxxExxY protein [Flavobacterium sp.]RZJ65799.1 MAG: GxxExxY protein [Flavobacterium sp.]